MISGQRPRTLADVIRRVQASEAETNPFGSDASTVRYAAEQVNLPSLAIQLRRIADEVEKLQARATP